MSRRRAPSAAVVADAAPPPAAKRAKSGTKPKPAAPELPAMGIIDWNAPGWKEVGQRVWHYWDGDKTWCAPRRPP